MLALLHRLKTLCIDSILIEWGDLSVNMYLAT